MDETIYKTTSFSSKTDLISSSAFDEQLASGKVKGEEGKKETTAL